MRTSLAICATLILAAMPAANAQQREAVLQRIEVPGASFDLVLAIPKTPAVIFDFSESPDAHVIHLVGGLLALGFESAESMLNASDSLRAAVGAFHLRDNESNARVPIAIYKISKGAILASAEK